MNYGINKELTHDTNSISVVSNFLHFPDFLIGISEDLKQAVQYIW